MIQDSQAVADKFGLAEAIVWEIVWENDEHPGAYGHKPDGSTGWRRETPEERWVRMRKWVDSNIKQVTP
ncbi:hypothetical protein M5G20_25975 [Pseudomonas sp. TNT2022 ID1044]|uniref:hypothetical protein n=1 Tax=Pseudomonas sp. TNT2022 ID1044 TaxID=2942636 RepID=UPI00235EEFDB|nr:hypothetical protein [Pseudomonas sp. TNT2022 ID1044]MDD0999292.1 hypothetical protein [Pseudomonas sp. TNT2022 ID1044]